MEDSFLREIDFPVNGLESDIPKFSAGSEIESWSFYESNSGKRFFLAIGRESLDQVILINESLILKVLGGFAYLISRSGEVTPVTNKYDFFEASLINSESGITVLWNFASLVLINYKGEFMLFDEVAKDDLKVINVSSEFIEFQGWVRSPDEIETFRIELKSW